MDFLSSFSVPPVFYLLIGVVFVLVCVEAIYLFWKRKKGSVKSDSSVVLPAQNIPVQPTPMIDAAANQTQGQNVVVTPTAKSEIPWRIMLPIGGVAVFAIMVLGGAFYLQQQKSQQDIRGRAEGNISVTGWSNNCGSDGSSTSPDSDSCRGSRASVRVTLKNNSGSDVQIQVRKQFFSCDDGDAGTKSCGSNARDEKGLKTIGANATLELEEISQSTPESGCGSAQVDYFYTTDLNPNTGDWGSAYWGFAWTGSNCSQPPTHTPVPPTDTPKPTKTPTPGATSTPTPAGPTNTPTPTATPPAGTTPTNTPIPLPASCVNLNFYLIDTENNDLFSKELSISDLKALKKGEKVNITVVGTSQSTHAQLKVYSDWEDLSAHRPISGGNGLIEYYNSDINKAFDVGDYPDKANFTIQGQVFE